MYSTHYYRKNLHVLKTVPSPNHSVVLAAVQSDKLICMEDIVKNVLLNKDNDTVNNAVEVGHLLKDLLNYEFIGEVHGLKIEKFLKNQG